MQLDERVAGEVTVVTLKGKMTLGEGDELLKACLTGLMASGRRHVVLDLEKVPYIDSAGFGEIVVGYTSVARHGGRLVLCKLTKRIRDLLSITKMLTVFEVYDSEDEAVLSFGTPRFEVSCPVCRPTNWVNLYQSTHVLSCTVCNVQSRLSITSQTLAPLDSTPAGGTPPLVTTRVQQLSWLTYKDQFARERVELTLGRPSTIAVSGRLDLFTLDVVQTAWRLVPPPRRVVLDATKVGDSTAVARAKMEELCAVVEGGSRAAILTPTINPGTPQQEVVFSGPAAYVDRDRAIVALGDLGDVAPSIEIRIRRRA